MIFEDMPFVNQQTATCRQGSFTSLPTTDEESTCSTATSRYLRSANFTQPPQDEPIAELSLQNMIARKTVNRLFREGLVSVATLRPDLVSFMRSLCRQLQYSLNTFYLAVAYLDCVFGQYSVKQAQGRVLAFSALMLAAKLEENVEKIPAMNDTVSFFDNQYSEESLVFFERIIAECLSFKFNLKTPFSFLNAYLSLGVVREDECSMVDDPLSVGGIVATLESVGALFVEIGTLAYEFNQYDSQTVAASAIVCARSCLGFEMVGESLMERLRVKWTDIEGCVGAMLSSAKFTQSECYFRFQDKIDGMQFEIQQLKNRRTDGRQTSSRSAVTSAVKERPLRSARKSAVRLDEESFQPETPQKSQFSETSLNCLSSIKRGRRGVEERRTA